MTYHATIITAGTSALSGRNAAGRWLREHPEWASFPGGPECKPPKDKSPDEAMAAVVDHLSDLPPTEDPKAVSAEYSLVHALSVEGLLGNAPRVTLITTDTFDGQLAATCVKAALTRDFNAHVRLIIVDDFNVKDRRAFQRGLGRMLSEISNVLEHHDPYSTCFAPIGGFKVMTSLAYLLGCFHGFSSMYLHETLQVLHEIPAVPVRVSPEELAPIAPLFRRILLDNGITGTIELTPTEQNAPELKTFRWLFDIDEVDGLLALNAMGIFLVQQPAYRPILGVRILLSKEAQKLFERDRENTRQSLRRLTDLLLQGTGSGNDLYHERDWQNKLKASPTCHLYRDRKKDVVFRATWTQAPQEGAIYIHRVWTDHKAYDREARGALVAPARPKDMNGWVDVREAIYLR